MAELVSYHRLELRDRDRLQQRQPDAHHAAAAETHDAPSLRDEGVDIGDQVDLGRHLLSRGPRHFFDGWEQIRLACAVQARAGRGEAVGPRDDGPYDNRRTDYAEER